MQFVTIGASGYIGQQLVREAEKHGNSLGTSTSGEDGLLAFDLSDAETFDYSRINSGDTIFLLAGVSRPDICHSRPDFVRAVNVTGTIAFVTKVLSKGAKVIFFSTDTVYGEKTEAFDETALCSPLGPYAEMKHEVEKHFLGNPSFKSIRLSYVFSKVDGFTRYLIGCNDKSETAELFHPFNRAVVHRNDVVDGAIALALKWDQVPHDVINFGGPQVLSRIDFAEGLKNVALNNLSYDVEEPDADFFKARPREIAMTSPILPQLLDRPSHSLEDAAKIEFL